MNDIHDFLAQLALQRPIFHSEADFQHAFAWELHLVFPEALVRLEYPMLSHGEQIYVDLWAELDDTAIAVELKYKPRGITVLSRGERYTLRDQAAQPINRYYFAKDIQRLEEITLSSDAIAHKKVFRHAVLLTNDSAYWKSPRQPGTTSESFSLHDGHVLSGTLEWGVDTGIGTKKSREDSIQLNGSYFLKWNSYSSFDAKSYGAFRYLAVEPVMNFEYVTFPSPCLPEASCPSPTQARRGTKDRIAPPRPVDVGEGAGGEGSKVHNTL